MVHGLDLGSGHGAQIREKPYQTKKAPVGRQGLFLFRLDVDLFYGCGWFVEGGGILVQQGIQLGLLDRRQVMGAILPEEGQFLLAGGFQASPQAGGLFVRQLTGLKPRLDQHRLVHQTGVELVDQGGGALHRG